MQQSQFCQWRLCVVCLMPVRPVSGLFILYSAYNVYVFVWCRYDMFKCRLAGAASLSSSLGLLVAALFIWMLAYWLSVSLATQAHVASVLPCLCLLTLLILVQFYIHIIYIMYLHCHLRASYYIISKLYINLDLV